MPSIRLAHVGSRRHTSPPSVTFTTRHAHVCPHHHTSSHCIVRATFLVRNRPHQCLTVLVPSPSVLLLISHSHRPCLSAMPPVYPLPHTTLPRPSPVSTLVDTPPTCPWPPDTPSDVDIVPSSNQPSTVLPPPLPCIKHNCPYRTPMTVFCWYLWLAA